MTAPVPRFATEDDHLLLDGLTLVRRLAAGALTMTARANFPTRGLGVRVFRP